MLLPARRCDYSVLSTRPFRTGPGLCGGTAGASHAGRESRADLSRESAGSRAGRDGALLRPVGGRWIGAGATGPQLAAPLASSGGAQVVCGDGPHPLDPLTADEIRHAAASLRRDQGVTDRWRFASIELREPSKQTVRDHRPGAPFTREARVVCWNRDDGQAYKALVSLTGNRVTNWRHEPDGQPNMTVDEFNECDQSMRRETRVIAALARRGITDMDRVLIEAWAYGAHL
jgi:Cu2+-containing amine oxidase